MYKIAKILAVAGALWLGTASAMACTIVILVDENGVLFCHNEDWNLTKTRIWFVSSGPGRFGAVYVGFDLMGRAA